MTAKTGKVNKGLEKMINDLLREVRTGTDEDGKKYTLTDKMKVIDRALKLEAIKMKADDSGYGSGFSDTPDPDDENGDN